MKILFKKNSVLGETLPAVVTAGEPIWYKDNLYVGSVGLANGGVENPGVPVRVSGIMNPISNGLANEEWETVVRYQTTQYWDVEHADFVPKAGEIIIYTDWGSVEIDEEDVSVPAIKIGDGTTPVNELQVVAGDLYAKVQFWNNKLNLDENVENERLVFNRN